MSANPPGETQKEIVSQGGGACVSFSGGDERSEPENAICPVSQVDLHGQPEGVGDAPARSAGALPALPCLFKHLHRRATKRRHRQGCQARSPSGPKHCV